MRRLSFSRFSRGSHSEGVWRQGRHRGVGGHTLAVPVVVVRVVAPQVVQLRRHNALSGTLTAFGGHGAQPNHEPSADLKDARII